MWGISQVADLAIAVAYFLIPIEMITCLISKRYAWMIGRKAWAVSVLFICFIFLCGCTHMLNVVGGGVGMARLRTVFKVLTAIVSVATSVLLCWIIPEALSLPQYVRDITAENKLMRDFRAVTNTMRRVLQEEAIIDNARLKLKRVLPPHALICIGKEPPADYCGSRELLSLPIDGQLAMHLRRSRLSEAQVTWLHDICVQMKIALQQAAHLRSTQFSSSSAPPPQTVSPSSSPAAAAAALPPAPPTLSCSLSNDSTLLAALSAPKHPPFTGLLGGGPSYPSMEGLLSLSQESSHYSSSYASYSQRAPHPAALVEAEEQRRVLMLLSTQRELAKARAMAAERLVRIRTLAHLLKPRAVSCAASASSKGPPAPSPSPCVPPLVGEQVDVLNLILAACDTRDFLHLPPSLNPSHTLHA